MLKYLFILIMLLPSFVCATETIKISELGTGTAVTNDDYLVFVDNPGGTPVTKKITFENFVLSLGLADLLTSLDLSTVTISGGTASRMAEWDGSGNLTSSDTATTGTGAPVKATGPTITLGENSTINNGAAPTVNAAGEVAIDTTTDQLKYYGGAVRVLPYIQYLSFVIPAPAETDDINIMKAPYGMTIIGIDCIVQGTTSATGQIQECDSAGANCADLDSDITCDADGAADDGTLTDSAIASGGWLRWKTTSLSGTPTFLTVTVRYSVVAD